MLERGICINIITIQLFAGPDDDESLTIPPGSTASIKICDERMPPDSSVTSLNVIKLDTSPGNIVTITAELADGTEVEIEVKTKYFTAIALLFKLIITG